MQELAEAIRHLETGDWEAAHQIVQSDSSPAGCWAHGIVHLLEGDLANARYWYGRASRKFSEPLVIATEVAALKASLSGGI